jgi:acyl homoserine lactone synthase
MERDRFDGLSPVHMSYRNEEGRIEGYWRLLPTSGPYMLQDVFPSLLRGETAPNHPSVWEISRFAVVPEGKDGRDQASLCTITFKMLQAGVSFAMESGIRHYVFVTSVAVERLLRRAGLTLHRFGDSKAQQIGKVLSVACWIDINEETYRAVYKVPKTAVGMEAA